MKKILFCASVDYHFTAFHLPILKLFKDQGWEVHIAASGSIAVPFVDQKFTIPIQRSPFHTKNLSAYKTLKKILKQNHYDIIHCHTPMGGVLSRLAARDSRKRGTKVIYTAHGFHFCKGAPLMNWLIYYPIEKMLSSFTDSLITINQEDYQLAKKHHFSAQTIAKIQGVGVDTEKFKPEKGRMVGYSRFKHGYKRNDFLLFYAAEFNKNKNQKLLIHILAKIHKKIPNVKLLLAGEGMQMESCKRLAKQLGVMEHIGFLGHREDIHELLPMCDLVVASSLREGLPVNIMEAMACEIPVVATANRGHKELIKDHVTGCLFEPSSIEQAAYQIEKLAKDPMKRRQYGAAARQEVIEQYSVHKIIEECSHLYRPYMGREEDARWILQ